MPSITELRTTAQQKGKALLARFDELKRIEEQVKAEKETLKAQIENINGEIIAYNKMEEAPVTEVEPTPAPNPVE